MAVHDGDDAVASGSPTKAGIAATVLCLASLAVFWPGIPLYDSVAQFRQALSGEYDDWHPPAMAHVWAMLHAGFGGGAGPMLALQMLLYWSGFGLLAVALAKVGRHRAAWAVLVLAMWPPFLGWQAAVLKDAQMTGAMLAATGLIGWWRLRGRRLPIGALALVTALLGYAVLVRANAVFAVVPLAVMLVPGWRHLIRLVAMVAGVGVVLALAGPINHDLLAARHSGVERTEAIYDLAGIAVRVPDAAGLPLDRAQIATLVERHCVKPFFWDPLGEPARCDGVVDPLRHVAPGTLYLALARTALMHPVAYAGHRLAHLNSTSRLLVPSGWTSAAPPVIGEPNDLGLPGPGHTAAAFERLAGGLVETPFAWPIAWIVVAATAWGVAVGSPAAPARDLALALATSALVLESSFAGLSIASDLRYHLWSMIAAALAALLLAGPAAPRARRSWRVGGAMLTVVVAAGVAARLLLPTAPASYAAMLVW
ncbi:MAG: hypothetical protein ACRYHC_04855 [Janthinobacterium lividum]